jgi:hypothetical protein
LEVSNQKLSYLMLVVYQYNDDKTNKSGSVGKKARECKPYKLKNKHLIDNVEIKSVLFTPTSHHFVERLIGTIRREVLDHALL